MLLLALLLLLLLARLDQVLAPAHQAGLLAGGGPFLLLLGRDHGLVDPVPVGPGQHHAHIAGLGGAKSQELADALQGGTKIIIVTIQTFPYALELIRTQADLKGENFAIIADEAHSSQAGEASQRLKAAEMAARAEAKNLSFFAFTATPKAGHRQLQGIPFGVLRPDDSAVREIEDALRIAERSGDDFALTLARRTLGVALYTGVSTDDGVDRPFQPGSVHLAFIGIGGEPPDAHCWRSPASNVQSLFAPDVVEGQE